VRELGAPNGIWGMLPPQPMAAGAQRNQPVRSRTV